jgi:hypothetical protein
MKIALDFDMTYTLDPEMWDMIIEGLVWKKHDVRIVTTRNPIHDKIQRDVKIPIIYCDGIAKRYYCHWFVDDGWDPDIWVDDKPQSVDNNSPTTREQLTEWRATRTELT